MTRSLALPVLALTLLAGCGSDDASTGAFSALRGLATEVVASTDAAPQKILSRDDIRAVDAPLIMVEVPATETTGYLGVQAVRGDVTVWSTVSRQTVALKGGQLIQTRGLGGDLLSASAPSLNDLLTGQTITRRYAHLDGAEGTLETVVTCTPRVVGRETVQIVGLAYETARVDESCSGDGVSFDNSFWIDSGGNLRQSLQWAGPFLGQVRISGLQE